MATSKALKEKQLNLVHQAQEILNTAESEDRSMSAEERENWETIHKDADALGKRAKDLYDQETLSLIPDDQLIEQTPGHAPSTTDTRDDGEVTTDEAFRAWALGQHADQRSIDRCRNAGFNPSTTTLEMRHRRPAGWTQPRSVAEARRLLDASREQRAQSVGTTTEGGFTAPDSMMREIDIALLHFGGMRQVATVLPTDTGTDMPIPTVNDTAVLGEIIDENTTANDGDVTFGQLVLNAFKYSSKMIKVSIELMQDSATDLPALIGRLAGERLGRILNQHFTTGAGTTEPLGMTVAATDSTIDQAVAGTLEWDTELLELKHSVDIAYRNMGASWMMDDSTLLDAKQIQDSQGRPLWLPGLSAGESQTFDGDPIVINNDMPNAVLGDEFICYGALSKYLIRDVMNPAFTVTRLDERFAELGQVAFLVWSRHDGALLDAGTNPVKFMQRA